MTALVISAILVLVKDLNGEETLWVILPILIVVVILVASIVILPKTQTNIGSKASTPTATPTKVVLATPTPTISERPEVICSSLYSPVCSQTGVTYVNQCEAEKMGVTVFTKGECKTVKKVSPQTLPSSN